MVTKKKIKKQTTKKSTTKRTTKRTAKKAVIARNEVTKQSHQLIEPAHVKQGGITPSTQWQVALAALRRRETEKTIYLDRAELQNTLKVALDFINKNDHMPILQCVKLVTDNGECTISATDLEVSWSKIILFEGDLISICIPATVLYKEVAALPSEISEVELTFKKEAVHINGRCKIYTMDVDDYPILPSLDAQEAKETKINDLLIGLKHILRAIGDGDPRYTLNGACIDLESKKILATDGHRLHFDDIQIKDLFILEKTINKQLIIPKSAATLAVKHAASNSIKLTNDFISLHLAGGVMLARLIDGNFPKYTNIIPEDNPIKTEFSTNEFLKILEGALPLVGNSSGIKLTFNGALVIQSQNPELGSYKWEMPCHVTGMESDEFAIGFNAQYLIDAVKSYDENGLAILEMLNQERPCLINKKAVVMPMRI